MQLSKSVATAISEESGFISYVKGVYQHNVRDTGIVLTFDPFRLQWAYDFWSHDIARVAEQVGGEPCHLKRAGFLTFWLRREPPIESWDTSAAYTSGNKQIDYQTDFLMRYGREYCAFIAGYELALFYECNKSGGPYARSKFQLTQTYIDDMVELLKRKSVSPHAMYMIFKSIFNTGQQKLGPNF